MLIDDCIFHISIIPCWWCFFRHIHHFFVCFIWINFSFDWSKWFDCVINCLTLFWLCFVWVVNVCDCIGCANDNTMSSFKSCCFIHHTFPINLLMTFPSHSFTHSHHPLHLSPLILISLVILLECWGNKKVEWGVVEYVLLQLFGDASEQWRDMNTLEFSVHFDILNIREENRRDRMFHCILNVINDIN